jgi:hypothetical protein
MKTCSNCSNWLAYVKDAIFGDCKIPLPKDEKYTRVTRMSFVCDKWRQKGE